MPQSILSLLVLFIVIFGASMLVSYGVVKLILKLRPKPTLPENALLRIKSPSGLYRARYLGTSKEGFLLSAPMQRDRHVPLRVGEDLVIEASAPGGALLFRSRVVARQTDPHALVVALPKKIHRIERRETPRSRDAEGELVRVENARAWIIDLSPEGIRCECDALVAKGERVRIDFPGESDPAYGWVLDVMPSGDGRTIARMRFEETFAAETKKFAVR